jgi:hypothetical protein
MKSNANITGRRNARKGSIAGDRAVVTATRLPTIDDLTAELQDAISHLTLFGLDDFKIVPEATTESSENLGYTSEFETFCAKLGVDQPYPDNHIPFRTFIYNKTLEPCSEDPKDYPGIQHAAALLLRDSEAEDGDNFGLLDEELQDMLMNVLNCRCAADLSRDRFVPGKVIGDGKTGKEWAKTSQLCDISGSYNRGIYLVRNPTDMNG